jgi:hypothetical protein
VVVIGEERERERWYVQVGFCFRVFEVFLSPCSWNMYFSMVSCQMQSGVSDKNAMEEK